MELSGRRDVFVEKLIADNEYKRIFIIIRIRTQHQAAEYSVEQCGDKSRELTIIEPLASIDRDSVKKEKKKNFTALYNNNKNII